MRSHPLLDAYMAAVAKLDTASPAVITYDVYLAEEARTREALVAALSRAPEGEAWVLVPREPTREMWAAMGKAFYGHRNRHHDAVAQDFWTAALEAAPKLNIDEGLLGEGDRGSARAGSGAAGPSDCAEGDQPSQAGGANPSGGSDA